MIAQLEEKMLKGRMPEDSLFYYHSSEDRIVLSHALFWVMSKSIKGKLAKERTVLLIRQYEEEMLEAYLTEDDYFPEILHHCNVLFETLPLVISRLLELYPEKDVRKLVAIATVAGGYGGDMPEELCNELLDDIDFHFNKVKCFKIEQMLPQLNMMVEKEQKSLYS